jgi:hypothetical protein
MNKKEKYIKYIVGDLVSKTEIDYDQEKIKYPFLSNQPLYTTTSFLSYFFSLSHPLSLYNPFANHVRKVYGAHDEEIKIIWYQYKEKIQSLINNE